MTVLEIEPAGRRHAPRVAALATEQVHVVFDVASVAGAPLWSDAGALGAYDAKVVHRALLRVGLATPDRWACVRLSAQLLAGGGPIPETAEAIAAAAGVTDVVRGDESLAALGARAQALARVLACQSTALRELGMSRVSKIEAGAVPCIAEMEHAGMPCDRQRLEALLAQARREHADVAKLLRQALTSDDERNLLGEGQLNLDSDRELKAALGRRGHDVANVRAATLRSLPPHLAEPLGRYRKVQKLLSTYGDSLLQHIQPDGRVHPVFEQIGASTGRMSCHSPNLQGMLKDHGFRACFHASAGQRLVVADYATCELRILAEMSGDDVFLRAFAAGEDLHAVVASTMFGQRVTKEDAPVLRQRAKAINFGLIYGMGPALLAKQIGCSASEAQGLLRRYFATFPKIRGFLEDTSRRAMHDGYAVTLTGRRLFLTGIEDRAQAERIARNMPIQGTSADMTKLALTGLRSALRAMRGAQVVNAVHDEIVIECEESQAEAVSAIARREMLAAARALLPRTPMQVDVAVGEAWDK